MSPCDMVYSPNKYRETEGIKVRRIGYALDAATLQQVAYNHGIEMNINNMSQAQKAQIRYIAIMEQSNNVMGDMARTIESPANQLRILESRIETLKRAIGDSLMPVISAVLPYVTAFVQILGEAFRSIADFMGFELPVFDYSKTVSSNNADIADSFDEATAASEKFKGSLSSIDQLNIIGSKSSNSPKGNQFGTDLDLELPSYDFLGDLKKETSEAYNTLKTFFENALPWIETFGAALASVFVIKKAGNFITGLSNVKSAIFGLAGANSQKATKNISGIAGGLAAGASSGVLFYNGVKNLTKGTGNLGNNIAQVATGLGIAGTAMGIFIKMSNPIGAVITAVGAVTGAVIGWVQAQKELDEELAKTITFADNGGIAVSALADGFSNYFDTISNGYDDILNNSAAMEENRRKISDAASEVKNITDKFNALGGEISSDDFQKIKTDIEAIGKAVEENLGTSTQDLIITLTTKFSDFAREIGGDVDQMVSKFYLLQNMGNSAIAGYKQQMDTIVSEVMNGGLSDEEMSQKLTELNGLTMKMAGAQEVTPETIAFEKALENITNGNINLENEQAVKGAVSRITESANTAKEAVQTAMDSQLASLETDRQNYISWGVDVEFDAKFGEGSFKELFENARKTLEAGYETELKKIEVGKEAGLGVLLNQYDLNAETYANDKLAQNGIGFGSRWETWFNHGGATAKDDMYAAVALKNYKNAYSELASIKPIKEALDTAFEGVDDSEAKKIAKLIMQGMELGFIQSQEDLNAALSTIASGGMDTLRKEWDIHSPSKKAENISEYFMLGLIEGFSANKQKLYDTIDEIANTASSKMAKMKVFAPQYSSEDVGNSLSNTGIVGFATGAYMSSMQHNGTDSQTVSRVGQAWNDNGKPVEVNVNVQTDVELDGDKVGESAYRFSQRQMAYTNGY